MKKNKLFIALGVVLLLLALIAVFTISGGNQEEKLTKKLESIGSEFYSDFYYEQVTSGKTDEEVQEFLGRFTETGIKVDIDNLSRFNEEKYSDITETFVNKKDKIACDIRNTRAIILPKEPFGKTDFTVKAELDCGFEGVVETPNEPVEEPTDLIEE